MAERRMFAKTIIDSDAFLDMPLSTQCLYFHLNMRADDDGFINNPKKIQRMIGASDDDLKVLVTKKFIIPFESGIVVIKHWKIHNYIRGDRKKETVYAEEMELLEEKDNGAYTLKNETDIIERPMLIAEAETPRQKAYKESALPYSFEYKIKEAFKGKLCPCCGFKMQEYIEDGIKTSNRIPSIQHNTPISKGGKHELGNISIICKECNVTLQDTETSELNAQEVIEVWDKICQTSARQVTDKCPHRLGKVSIGKDSIDNITASEATSPADTAKASKHKYGEYKNVLLKDEELQKLKEEYRNWEDLIKYLDEYIEMKGYKAKSHYLCIKKWVVDAVSKKTKRTISAEEEFLNG